MSDRPNQSFNFGGDGNNIQVGDSNTQNIQQTFGGKAPTLDAVLGAVVESLPEDVREELVKEVIEPIQEEANLLAAMPPEEAEEKKPTVIERVTSLCGKLAPYAPTIQKSLLAFGEASLIAIAPPTGWIVGALLAAVRAVKPKDEESA